MSSKVLSLGNIYFQIDSLNYPLGDRVEFNKELVGSDYIVYPGSSALNFVRVAKSLELLPVFVGKMGDDLPGRQVREMLGNEGIDFHPIISPSHQTNLAINYVQGSNKSLLFVSGTANQSMEASEVSSKFDELISNVEYLYLGGIFKLKKLLPHMLELIEKAKAENVKVVLDHNRVTNATSRQDIDLMRKIISEADIYLPSKEELTEVFGVQSLDEALNMLKEGNKIVAVKDSNNGAYGIFNGNIIHVPAFPVSVKNTVGAGDSFNAGFIRAQIDGLDLEKSLRFACATAALKISSDFPPTVKEVAALAQL